VTLYLIFWLSTAYDCPFGLSKASSLRPFLCSPRIERRWKLTSYADETKRLVQEAKDAGDSEPLVLILNGARARQAAVAWTPAIK
jgi:hypothetical protein